jgi:NADH-quinone oxidoreductase subunit C
MGFSVVRTHELLITNSLKLVEVMEQNKLTLSELYKNFDGALVSVYEDLHEKNKDVIVTYRQNMEEVATFVKLRRIFNCDSAIDGFVVDCLENEHRFTVIYSVQSSTLNAGFRIVTKVADGSALVSLQNIYPAFNWVEREIWDLSGVFFIKHPDLRRILTDYGFRGHPLRKNFPISGFREVQYSDVTKQTVYTDV